MASYINAALNNVGQSINGPQKGPPRPVMERNHALLGMRLNTPMLLLLDIGVVTAALSGFPIDLLDRAVLQAGYHLARYSVTGSLHGKNKDLVQIGTWLVPTGLFAAWLTGSNDAAKWIAVYLAGYNLLLDAYLH